MILPALRTKYSNFLIESFLDRKEFALTMKHSFEEFLNRDTRTAQYLSSYVDSVLKQGAKTQQDNELEQRLDEVGQRAGTAAG